MRLWTDWFSDRNKENPVMVEFMDIVVVIGFAASWFIVIVILAAIIFSMCGRPSR